MSAWVDSEQLRTGATTAIALLGLGALAVWHFVNKLALRLTLLAVIAALAGVMWISRVELGECAQHCRCRLLGADIEVPACRERGTFRDQPAESG